MRAAWTDTVAQVYEKLFRRRTPTRWRFVPEQSKQQYCSRQLSNILSLFAAAEQRRNSIVIVVFNTHGFDPFDP